MAVTKPEFNSGRVDPHFPSVLASGARLATEALGNQHDYLMCNLLSPSCPLPG